jgi:hypothetical protein
MRVPERLCSKDVGVRMDVNFYTHAVLFRNGCQRGLRLIPELAYCGLTG